MKLFSIPALTVALRRNIQRFELLSDTQAIKQAQEDMDHLVEELARRKKKETLLTPSPPTDL